MNIIALAELIDEYLLTVDNTEDKEFCLTDRQFAHRELEDFLGWLAARYGKPLPALASDPWKAEPEKL